MNTINIYGKPSYPYSFIKSSLENLIKEADLGLQLVEVQDMNRFISDKIEHIPAIKYKGETRIFENSNLNEFSNSLKSWILKRENFGGLKKIVVPVDYSSSSENALAYAKCLNDKNNNLITLLHSYTPKQIITDSEAQIDILLENKEEEKFRDYVDSLNNKWIGENRSDRLSFESEYVIGYPSDSIIATSKELDNGIIVMGSTGDSGLQKRVFGSVSTKVAKNAQCPLLIIPEMASYQGFKNVMYCCNDLSLDANMVNPLIDLLSCQDAQIYLAHFDSDYDYKSESLLKVWREFYDSDKIQYAEFKENISKERTKNFCDENKIDLIVIARPKRSGLENLLHRSFAKEMTIFSEIPLLILNQK